MMVVIESDHNSVTDAALAERKAEVEAELPMEGDENLFDPTVFGRPRPGAGQWASVIRVVDPATVCWRVCVCCVHAHLHGSFWCGLGSIPSACPPFLP